MSELNVTKQDIKVKIYFKINFYYQASKINVTIKTLKKSKNQALLKELKNIISKWKKVVNQDEPEKNTNTNPKPKPNPNPNPKVKSPIKEEKDEFPEKYLLDGVSHRNNTRKKLYLNLKTCLENEEDIKIKLVKLVCEAHSEVETLRDDFMDELGRKVYITPKTFLDMNNLLMTLLETKKSENQKKIEILEDGTKKIKKTQEDIVRLEDEIRKIEPEIADKEKYLEGYVKKIKVQKEEVQKQRVKVNDFVILLKYLDNNNKKCNKDNNNSEAEIKISEINVSPFIFLVNSFTSAIFSFVLP